MQYKVTFLYLSIVFIVIIFVTIVRQAGKLDKAGDGCYHQHMSTDKPRLTIRDIANACGVSTATVSYVLNDRSEEHISEQTRNRILHYVNLHGYETSVVARALATGQNHAAGVYAPNARGSGGRAGETLLFLTGLTAALESRGMRTLLLSEQCTKQRSAHVDAIVAVDLTREEFYAVGEQNFCPLLCVDGCVDDLMLFYQIYDDFFAIAARARELSGKQRLFFLHDPYADEGIGRRVRAAFDEVCVPDDPCLPERAGACSDSTAFVAMGRANYERLRALGIDAIPVACAGERLPGDAADRAIRLATEKKAETVAQLVMDTVARRSGPEHDVRVF